MIRTYVPMKLSQPDMDAGLRSDLESVNTWLRMLSTYMARVPALPQGTPSALTPPAVTPTTLGDYLYLPGRIAGQQAAGHSGNSSPVIPSPPPGTGYRAGMSLLGFNFWDSSATAITDNNPARVEIGTGLTNGSVDFYCSAINIGPRFGGPPGTFYAMDIAVSQTSGSGLASVFTADVSLDGGIYIGATGVEQAAYLSINNYSGRTAGVLVTLGGAVGQTGNFLENYDGSTSLLLSSIRADGAWVGPIVASGTDTHPDNIFQIVGSATPTKIAMFEVDGFAAPVTRTFTLPDASGTIILSQGPAAGQVIGTTSHAGGSASSLVIEGPVAITSVASSGFTSGRMLEVNITPTVFTSGYFAIAGTLAGIVGAAAGTLTLADIRITTGVTGLTSGSYTFNGFNFQASANLAPSGVTCTAANAARFQNSPSEGSGGTGLIDVMRGTYTIMQGPTTTGGSIVSSTTTITSPTVTMGSTANLVAGMEVYNNANIPARTTILSVDSATQITISNNATASATTNTTYQKSSTVIVGHDLELANRNKPVVNMYGLRMLLNGTQVRYIQNFSGIEMTTAIGDIANCSNWSLFRHALTIANPTNIWLLDFTSTNSSRHAGRFSLGLTTAPAHWLDLGAGTTAVAPIRLASGTNLTAATAGCVEYDGSYVYLTHGDAVRTKAVTQRGQVDATAQAAAIGVTTLYSPPAAGYYVVHYTLEDTTSDITAGTIQFQINYTDDIGATTQTGAALAMTAVGRDRGSFQVYSASGVISYQTNLTGIFGTARYALRVRVVALG